MKTPIAEKDFGLDLESGLDKKLQVWSLYCDADVEEIVVGYKIVLVSPTGLPISVIKRGTYVRNGLAFQELRNGQLGAGITAKINSALDGIRSYETIDVDLKQE